MSGPKEVSITNHEHVRDASNIHNVMNIYNIYIIANIDNIHIVANIDGTEGTQMLFILVTLESTHGKQLKVDFKDRVNEQATCPWSI